MNSGITLVDARSEAMQTIRDIRTGKIEVKEAQIIKGLLDTVIDTAKTQVEFIKAIPNSVKEQMTVDEVKAIAGTLIDRDAELDQSMKQITEGEKTYIISE